MNRLIVLATYVLFGAVGSGLATDAAAAGISVGAGSIVHFGDATMDLGCGDLAVAGNADANAGALTGIANVALNGGALSLGAALISLGGDFVNTGSFVPGTSTVRIGDACGNGTSRLFGASSFYDLQIISANGKLAVFPVSLAQSVANALTLQGAAGKLLNVASSTSGQRGAIALANGAAQMIAYVDARDNVASIAHIAPGPAMLFNSVDGGNLVNWFASGTPTGGTAAVPAPAAGGWMLLLLAGLIVTLGWKRSSTPN